MSASLTKAVSAAVADTCALMVFGGVVDLREGSLTGILAFEIFVLGLTWGCVFAFCRRRRAALVAVAGRSYPALRVSPFLTLRDRRLEMLRDQTMGGRWQYTLGRWLTLACSAMITYSMYQPSLSRYLPFVADLGRLCPDEACLASCRLGRKLHVGKSAIFILVQLYGSGVRHGRRGENGINTALRALIWLPFLAAKWTSTCWVGRGLQVLKASPLLNASKGLITMLGMEVFLPSGPLESLLSHLATSLALSFFLCWMPWPNKFLHRSDPLYVIAVAVFPVLFLASFAYILAYFRESRQLSAFLLRRVHTARQRLH